MRHWFNNRNAVVPAKRAAEIFAAGEGKIITRDDAIKCLGFRPQAVDSAIKTKMCEVQFHQELLERCIGTHALIFVHGKPADMQKFADTTNRLLLPRKSKRGGFTFRFHSAPEGWYLVRLTPHPDTYGCGSAEQEDFIGHAQSGESVAGAYVAAFAAVGLYEKYGIDITGESGVARTSDNIGNDLATLLSYKDGRFAIEAQRDEADDAIGAISMIEPH